LKEARGDEQFVPESNELRALGASPMLGKRQKGGKKMKDKSNTINARQLI
jgi:hypothetical protein